MCMTNVTKINPKSFPKREAQNEQSRGDRKRWPWRLKVGRSLCRFLYSYYGHSPTLFQLNRILCQLQIPVAKKPEWKRAPKWLFYMVPIIWVAQRSHTLCKISTARSSSISGLRVSAVSLDRWYGRFLHGWWLVGHGFLMDSTSGCDLLEWVGIGE